MDTPLKLMALDGEDLTVVSAHAQDAVLKPATIVFDKAAKTLVVPMNRFAWEAKASRRLFFKRHQRRSSVLRLAGVQSVRSRGINRSDEDAVASLLSITFEPDGAESPEGTIRLTFSGGARLDARVDCIELQLTDLGAAWETSAKPRH
ncbi:MAG: DUF2948 family protein [Pseudomonadota bacterium]